MNILLVSPLPPPIGGIASWTEDYKKYCEENQIRVSLINTAIVGSRANNVNKISLLDELKRCAHTRKQIKSTLQKQNFNVLHYSASCSRFGLIRDFVLLRKLNVPVVYHCHCDLSVVINNIISTVVFKAICKFSSFVLALNTQSLELAKKYTSKVEYIPNFASEIYDNKNPIRSSLEKIIYVGRLTREKGVSEIIQVAKKYPGKQFVLVGPLDDEIDIPENTNIITKGKKEHKEAIELMLDSDVVILPSYSEGFPLTVLEGMSCGLPIIATKVGAIPDMIGENGGILVDKGNVEQIAQAIERLESKELRESMRHYNIEKVKNSYMIEKVMAKLIKIYEQCS